MRIRGFLTKVTIFGLIAFAVLEGALRLAQGGCYSYLPYRRPGAFPVLPPSASFCFINSQRARIAYATDSEGARRRSVTDTGVPCRHCVIAVGDSQALGYGLAYADTFTARYAARRGREAVLIAAPADDPDTEKLAAAHYIAATGTRPDMLFVVVNFGNDVDELYTWRRARNTQTSGRSSWLAEHSFIYGDLALAGRIVARKLVHTTSLPTTIPPGINPVAFALAPREIPAVTTALAQDVQDIIGETHAAASVAVLIPPDTVLDPREFDKYRRYYTGAEFANWKTRLSRMSAIMNSLENGLGRTLRSRGVRVLDTRDVLATVPGTLAFDRYSHHLSEFANELISEALK